MTSRRDFLKKSTLAVSALPFLKPSKTFSESLTKTVKPIVISTWHFGVPANDEAWKVLSAGGRALDAVEAGVQVPEGDPKVNSVGYGGLPDREGRVTLDSCIMDENANCGSVAFLEDIMHPVCVARKVMEKTEYIMLVGSGAKKFAIENGFKKENLLTPESKKAWLSWLKNSNPKPDPNIYHDTIGMLALDLNGNLSGACTTSGLSYKIHGRVGDSPIIGAGLFVDNEVGAATATGTGEEVIRVSGSHTVVEYMRQGYSPMDACKETIKRVKSKMKSKKSDTQVAFIALNKKGSYGAYALINGFEYAVYSIEENNVLKKSDYLK